MRTDGKLYIATMYTSIEYNKHANTLKPSCACVRRVKNGDRAAEREK